MGIKKDIQRKIDDCIAEVDAVLARSFRESGCMHWVGEVEHLRAFFFILAGGKWRPGLPRLTVYTHPFGPEKRTYRES